MFDAAFFNIKPAEAHSIDPRHQTLLGVHRGGRQDAAARCGHGRREAGYYYTRLVGIKREVDQRDVF